MRQSEAQEAIWKIFPPWLNIQTTQRISTWNGTTTKHGTMVHPLSLRFSEKGARSHRVANWQWHFPTVVSISDDGKIKHDGRAPGFLYCIAEDIGPRDIHPHPHSSIEYGKEWLTDRDLKVVLLCPTCVLEKEMLTEKEVNDLRTKACSMNQQTKR